MRDRTILALKGLAIIGVVFHHVSNRRLDPLADQWIKDIVFVFNWCVLGFFCVSGYLQAMSDAKKQKTLLEFIPARFSRLLVPYALLSLFYCCVWQTVQAFHIPNIGVKVPPDFIGKLEDILWPVNGMVAQQLYFFPLLFAISLVLVLVQRGLGLNGLWAAAWIAGVVGLAYFPHLYTGFAWGVFLWGICFYASGYLLFHYRANKFAIRVALVAFTAVLIVLSGSYGVVRCIPLWLLSEGPILRLDQAPLLGRLGDASGTIYIYHTPFIIQPLAILATDLPGPFAQFAGEVLGVALAIALCSAGFELLQNTKAKVLLM